MARRKNWKINEDPVNRRCETCRFAHAWSTPYGRETPPDSGIDCNLADNPEDYDPAEVEIPENMELIDGEGCDKPCRFWKGWEECSQHPGELINPSADYGCPKCDEEGYAAEAADYAVYVADCRMDHEADWRRERE